MDIKIDKMRFQENKISYLLALLSIIFNIIYLFTVINNKYITPDFSIGVKILLNIAFILIVFLAMVKVKVYQFNWAIILLVLSGITLLRIFYMPIKVLKNEQLQNEFVNRFLFIKMNLAYELIFYLILIAGLLFASGFLAFQKSRALRNYMQEKNLK